MRWRDLPKPTIAQVQGYCIMGGMMIASACDLIIASDDALFADRAVKWGGATCSISRCRGTSARARPRNISSPASSSAPPKPSRLGLVNRVVPRAKLEEETMELAQQIAERDPYALKLAKASVNETQDAQGWRAAMEGASRTTC